MQKDADTSFNSLNLLSMLSVTTLIFSMLFSYRVIEIGPFICPGGIFAFPFIYFFADIIAEVHGYRAAKKMIFNNVVCITLFNLIAYLSLKAPVKPGIPNLSTFNYVFGHGLSITVAYSLAFYTSDYANVFILTWCKNILKGDSFWIRSIISSAIGELSFSLVASLIIYAGTLTFHDIVQQITSTFAIKIIITILLAKPAALIVRMIEKREYSPVISDGLPEYRNNMLN